MGLGEKWDVRQPWKHDGNLENMDKLTYIQSGPVL